MKFQYANIIAIFFWGVVILFPTSALAESQTINLLTWQGYAPQKQVDFFEKYIKTKYGKNIKINPRYLTDGAEVFKIVRSGWPHIFSAAHFILNDERFKFIENNIIIPLDLKNIPNYKYVFDVFKPYVSSGDKTYAIPLSHGPVCLVYNTAYFQKPPASWNIFWDPAYKGKYATTNGTTEANIYITALAMGYSEADMYVYTKLNNNAFKERLESLVANADSFWPGVDEAYHLKGLYFALSWGWALSGLKDFGETWKIAEPKEGTLTWLDFHALTHALRDKPFLKLVAEEWVNYTISEEFQVEVVINSLSSYPVSRDIEKKLTKQQIKKFHINDPDYFSKHRRMWPTIRSQRDRNGLKILWENAIKGKTLKIRKQN